MNDREIALAATPVAFVAESGEDAVFQILVPANTPLYSQEQVIAILDEIEGLKKQLAIAELKNKGTLANNLCPDCRDKQVGQPCLACTIQTLKAQVEMAREALDHIAHPIAYEQAHLKAGHELNVPLLLSMLDNANYYMSIAQNTLTALSSPNVKDSHHD